MFLNWSPLSTNYSDLSFQHIKSADCLHNLDYLKNHRVAGNRKGFHQEFYLVISYRVKIKCSVFKYEAHFENPCQQCICSACANMQSAFVILREIGNLFNVEPLKNINFADVLNIITKLGSNHCKNHLDPQNYISLLEYTFVLQNTGHHCTKCTKLEKYCTYCNWMDRGDIEKHLRSLLTGNDLSKKIRYERIGLKISSDCFINFSF